MHGPSGPGLAVRRLKKCLGRRGRGTPRGTVSGTGTWGVLLRGTKVFVTTYVWVVTKENVSPNGDTAMCLQITEQLGLGVLARSASDICGGGASDRAASGFFDRSDELPFGGKSDGAKSAFAQDTSPVPAACHFSASKRPAAFSPWG